jgi:Cupredoxin-like domain
MKKGLVVVVASLAFSLLVAAPAIPAGPATTSPGYNFTINVTVKDNDVTLSRSVAKRGWRAHFVIANRGTKPHVFDIGGLKTAPIAPGQKRKLGAFLDERGKYPYKVDRKIRGYFSVV